MRLDGQVTSKNLDVRDFFNVFKLDEDPRFTQIEGTLETNARLHLVLGGPEDVCRGGYLDVQASVNAHKLNLLGEKFDEGHADFEYRWVDQRAGLEGAEIDVRSLSLTKVKRAGRAPLGSVLGSVSVHRGGEMRGSSSSRASRSAAPTSSARLAPKVEGAASGVARIGGTISAFDVDADVSVTPSASRRAVRGSDLHIVMTSSREGEGHREDGTAARPSMQPFDKEACSRTRPSRATTRSTARSSADR